MFEEFVLTASTADLSRSRRRPVSTPTPWSSGWIWRVTRSPSLTRTTASSRCSSRTGRRGRGGGRRPSDGTTRSTTALTHDAVAAVDIELAALRGNAPEGEESHATALRNTARETDVAVVVSVHDFESTPEPAALVDLLADAAAEGDVGKLATTAAASEDALAMIEATHEATAAGHRVATMCMGEPGRHTRAVTPCTARKSATRPSIPRTQRRPASTLATLRGLVDGLRGDDVGE